MTLYLSVMERIQSERESKRASKMRTVQYIPMQNQAPWKRKHGAVLESDEEDHAIGNVLLAATTLCNRLVDGVVTLTTAPQVQIYECKPILPSWATDHMGLSRC